jgi:hypothetical protein
MPLIPPCELWPLSRSTTTRARAGAMRNVCRWHGGLLSSAHETATEAACGNSGAGDGNRTRMTSLEGWGSTIELRPRDLPGRSKHRQLVTGSVPARTRCPHHRKDSAASQGPCERRSSLVTQADWFPASPTPPPPGGNTGLRAPSSAGRARASAGVAKQRATASPQATSSPLPRKLISVRKEFELYVRKVFGTA